jgi:hypothetical protein
MAIDKFASSISLMPVYLDTKKATGTCKIVVCGFRTRDFLRPSWLELFRRQRPISERPNIAGAGGFIMKPANTAAHLKQMESMPPRRFVVRT